MLTKSSAIMPIPPSAFLTEFHDKNDNQMTREQIIRYVTETAGEEPVISTTGKASRELFEIREQKNQSHKYDYFKNNI